MGDAAGTEGAVMGCDIHMYVEAREYPGGPWTARDMFRQLTDEYGTNTEHTEIYGDRDYALFNVLGYTGRRDEFAMISPLNGIPDDCSPEVQKELENWDSDGHSHSYLTLADLLAFDWTQQMRQEKRLNMEEFWNWMTAAQWRRLNDEPTVDEKAWWDRRRAVDKVIDGHEIEAGYYESEKEEENWLERREKFLAMFPADALVDVPFLTSYAHRFKEFFTVVIPALAMIRYESGMLANAQDVRIVFFFDN